MSLPATVSEIFDGQTTPSILVVGPYRHIDRWSIRWPIGLINVTTSLHRSPYVYW